MKLLLTSNGLSNPSIAKALFELVGKPASETNIAFIPTAANVEEGHKDWLINDLVNIQNTGVASLDIVDISALPMELWQPRLEEADVLFFSGGNSFYLMHSLNKSGLTGLLPELLKTKVWAGISAGSMVTNPTLALSNKDKQIYYEKDFSPELEKALGFVDFYTRPHLNSAHFPHASKDYIGEIAKNVPGKIYALDDNSAVKVVDGKVEVVSEGEYIIFN